SATGRARQARAFHRRYPRRPGRGAICGDVGGGAGDVTAAGREVRARSARRLLNVLEGLAGIAADDDQAERAARLFGAAEALRAAIDTPLAPGERADY